MKGKKINILYFKDLFFFYTKSTYLCKVLTYTIKKLISASWCYNYQHNNYQQCYQKLLNYEDFTLSNALKTAIKTWPVHAGLGTLSTLALNMNILQKLFKKLKTIVCWLILHHGFPIQSKIIVKLLRQKIPVTAVKLFHHKNLHSITKKKVESWLLALHHTMPKLITLKINAGLGRWECNWNPILWPW